MTASVSRIVHYVMQNGAHRPAIVVGVRGVSAGNVDLQIFLNGPLDGAAPGQGTMLRQDVKYAEDCAAETWHWPEREE